LNITKKAFCSSCIGSTAVPVRFRTLQTNKTNRTSIYNVVLNGRFFKPGFPKKRKKNPPDAGTVPKIPVGPKKMSFAVPGFVPPFPPESFFRKTRKKN